MARPSSASSRDFSVDFEDIIKNSESARKTKSQDLGSINRRKVPEVIISAIEDRAWVGALIQGEGCIETYYVKVSDSTTINLAVRMTDPEPVFRFADLCGLSRPARPRVRPRGLQPVWCKNIAGLRAVRILQEALPFLVGEKRREAERALNFFDSNGYRRGCFRPIVVWPPDEFPLRRRRAPPRKQLTRSREPTKLL